MKNFIEKYWLYTTCLLWIGLQTRLVLAKLEIWGDLSGLNWFGVFAFSIVIGGIILLIIFGYLLWYFCLKDEAKGLDKKLGFTNTKK